MIKPIVLALLAAYKRWISPMFLPACKHLPTCSEYAMEAVEVHGVARGSLLSAWRLLRCNPFSRGGLDPVPGPKAKRLPDGPGWQPTTDN